MINKVKGDFDEALSTLIAGLVRAKGSHQLAVDLLYEWDQLRGNDWYTSTLKRDQKNNE